jgi:hypothetical protein
MRYEDLRRHVVEGEISIGWGAALLMQRGMVAWMKAWPANDRTAAEDDERIPEKEKNGVPLDIPDVPDREAISILVDMVMEHCREDVA